MWIKIDERIIKSGKVYSSKDFNPTQDDIAKIIALGGRAIARDRSRIMIFDEKGCFEESGPYFTNTKVKFATPIDLEVIDVIKSMGGRFQFKELVKKTGIPAEKLANTIYGRFRKMQWLIKEENNWWSLSDEFCD